MTHFTTEEEKRDYLDAVIAGNYTPCDHNIIELVGFLRELKYTRAEIKRFVYYFNQGLFG